MDLDRILDWYEESKRKQEALEQAEEQCRLQRIRTNAEDVQKCILKIIKPLFDSACKKIQARGYDCQIKVIYKQHSLADAENRYAVGIELYTKPEPESEDQFKRSLLSYEGDEISRTLERKRVVRSGHLGLPKEYQKTMELPAVTKDVIQMELIEFLKQVFKLAV